MVTNAGDGGPQACFEVSTHAARERHVVKTYPPLAAERARVCRDL